MLQSHDNFHSANGKRTILVVDDELINRELLRNILETEYEVITAKNGQEGLEALREKNGMVSLVLLDLMMPVMNGTDMLRCIKEDAATAQIPVIVLTSDQTAEIECLELGAIDFIPKPYPQAGVILARVRRTIELSEDRDIIQSTERDPLTGLYNREYFYRYAQQMDQYHSGMDMDALVVDIYHFRLINERFGAVYGDAVLRQVGKKLQDLVENSGGIVGRREADTFLIYCPHRTDYESMLGGDALSLDAVQDKENRVRLRVGIYSRVDKTIDIERRFDRAKTAADTVRASVTKTVALYDSGLHEKELYQEQLVEDFQRAIQEEQFQVYYQPKFDIRAQEPILSSAEALVRWRHPRLGMISPGVFIPLFEENGLIQELDTYVWVHAAAQLQAWKKRFGFVMPVSVNMSRIDMYDPHLIENLLDILSRHGLTSGEFLLEITESAYTQDSGQIIQTVSRLRELGFQIEMDDFGTGYSSLNMISALPIDALKVDMQFIRSAFDQKKDTRMLEVIIDIADYLAVPVIAEGVEQEEQVNALRLMGCDIVQGYYFSRPVPPEEYERFLEERQRQESKTSEQDAIPLLLGPKPRQARELGRIVHALAADYFCIYYVNTENDQFIEYSSHKEYQELGIEKSGDDFFGLLRGHFERVVYPEDLPQVLAAMDKPFLMNTLKANGIFTLTYRLLFDGRPTYVHMKISRMEDRSDPHIVIGMSSIDDQVRREQERERELARARELANRDALTGVKSKLAFTNAEQEWNWRILHDQAQPFAVALCDLNGLKNVNDTQGHKAGDAYIQQACSIICEIFRHSPVFRIGGDEFVAILSGQDYARRQDLMERVQQSNSLAPVDHRAVIACGMADYAPGKDTRFEDVFNRADAEMYINKAMLKGER